MAATAWCVVLLLRKAVLPPHSQGVAGCMCTWRGRLLFIKFSVLGSYSVVSWAPLPLEAADGANHFVLF
jgi:hypothetical protein